MTTNSDTVIRQADSDTLCSGFLPGQCVRIAVGLLEGLEATVIQHRSHGLVLVRLQHGVYIEIQWYCLETINNVDVGQ